MIILVDILREVHGNVQSPSNLVWPGKKKFLPNLADTIFNLNLPDKNECREQLQHYFLY